MLDNLLILAPDCLDKFAKLKAFHTRMAAREKLPICKLPPDWRLQENALKSKWETVEAFIRRPRTATTATCDYSSQCLTILTQRWSEEQMK